MTRWMELAVIGIAATWLAIFATTPPSPQPADAAADSFSATRAMEHVRIIASEPHPTGTEENAQVRAYLVTQLEQLGLGVTTTTGPVDEWGVDRLTRWSGEDQTGLMLTNIIAVLPGRDRSLESVLLMAHHDTVWASPGAPDATTAVATVLETVRAINSAGGADRDIIVLITDAEELGLVGARQFFAGNPLRENVGAIINMEARGGGGRTTLFQTSANNGEAVELFGRVAGRPGGSSLSTFIYRVLPNDTDLTPALEGDYVAYNFAFIGRSGLYHSPLATPENLDQGSLQDMGAQVLELTKALSSTDPLPADAPDRVFFDVFGLFLLSYPAWLGWLMLGIGGAGVAFAQASNWDGNAYLHGAGRMMGLILSSGIALYTFNLVSGAGEVANYYDRLAAIPMLEVMAALICIGAFLLAFGTWKPTLAGLTGAWLPLFLVAIAGQAIAPTAAYFVVIPVFLAGLNAVLGKITPGPIYQLSRAVVAIVITGYLLALSHQVMQGVGPTMPMAVSLPLALAALSILPIWQTQSTKSVRLAVAVMMIGAVAVACWVRFDPPAESIAAYGAVK